MSSSCAGASTAGANSPAPHNIFCIRYFATSTGHREQQPRPPQETANSNHYIFCDLHRTPRTATSTSTGHREQQPLHFLRPPQDTANSNLDATVGLDWRGATRGSGKLLIAVLGTGINWNHRDLQNARLWENSGESETANLADDDGNGVVDDRHGVLYRIVGGVTLAAVGGDEALDSGVMTSAGTATASLVNAVPGGDVFAEENTKGYGGTRRGVTGINYQSTKVQVMNVKVYDGSSSSLSVLAAGINYAAQQGARIMVHIATISATHAILETAYTNYLDTTKGLIIPAASYYTGLGAAGDDLDVNAGRAYCPVNCGVSGSVLAAGAPPGGSGGRPVLVPCGVTRDGAKATYFNYGQTSFDTGAFIWTRDLPAATAADSNSGYASSTMSFYSDSAGTLAGVAALVWTFRPHLTASQVNEIVGSKWGTIHEGGVPDPPNAAEPTPLGSMAGLVRSGGIVSAYNALRTAATWYPTLLGTSGLANETDRAQASMLSML